MSRRTQKRKVRSMMIVLLLTAMLLVSSTYAWFSTNRKVQITDITARVVAAEGLQISLDASKWSSSVSVTATTLSTAGQSASATGTKLSWPTALEPVSTVGETSGSDIVFKYGVLESNGADLSTITTAPINSDKYIAFDVYLKNSSSNVAGDELQLDIGSSIAINSTNGVANTGLENSVRVGFSLFNSSLGFTADVADIIAISGASKVCIWEPNFNKHITQIVNQDGRITSGTQRIQTFGLLSGATGDQAGVVTTTTAITDVCDLQYTLETANEVTGNAVTLQDFRTDPTNPEDFMLGQNKIMKMRVYVWLEGQDPDCLDIASTGKQFDLAINLRKPDPPSSP